uniref:Uncharacterized protein n=1 Tax=Aegilops tauschii subsp. strangulata TaxID=200361 RepID=A0A453B221_AEGTS
MCADSVAYCLTAIVVGAIGYLCIRWRQTRIFVRGTIFFSRWLARDEVDTDELMAGIKVAS